jgi:hypothetical protein
LPVIGQLAQVSQNMNQVPQAQPNPQLNAPANQGAHQRQAQPRNPNAQNQAQAQRKREVVGGGQSSRGQNSQKTSPVGLPTAQVSPQNNESVAPNPNPDKIEASEEKQKALDLLIPFIGECLVAGKQPTEAAQLSIGKLQETSLNPATVVPQFNGQELVEIARSLGIREEEYTGVEAWLKGYYEQIYNFANSTQETRESASV